MELREVAGRTVRRPEFDEAYLTDEDADFAGDFMFDEARVTDGEQQGVVGGGVVRDSVITGVYLTQARLSNLELSNCRLAELDLSNAMLAAIAMRTVELVTCRGIGLSLSIGQAGDLYVEDCTLDYSALEITKVRGVAVFHRCSFRDARITGDLSDVVFAECDFTGAEFTAARADRCDLPESQLVGAQGLLTLRGARITRDQAISVADALATEAGLVVVP
ncbi:MAG TPA: pentapeptide repeat-containing protein [Pseudonocardiaceae bacterium]|jgi:uncharacterized protein YjbI with pentapeptide repeats|nr:pentapeptide repeat-containing protein [Pseudonocardiaceae bacterium]